MSVIAIDTSARGRTVVVRVSRSGELAGEVVVGSAALPALQVALRRLLDDGPDAVVVVTGPGSYTGLRVGIAAGLGLAHAGGIPLHGVGSLDVVAAAAPAHVMDGMALSDAGRGGVYAARFHREAAGGLITLGPVARLALADVVEPGLVMVSLDVVPVPGLHRGDPGAALARAVPAALGRAPLDFEGLAATYLEPVAGAPGGPRVSSL